MSTSTGKDTTIDSDTPLSESEIDGRLCCERGLGCNLGGTDHGPPACRLLRAELESSDRESVGAMRYWWRYRKTLPLWRWHARRQALVMLHHYRSKALSAPTLRAVEIARQAEFNRLQRILKERAQKVVTAQPIMTVSGTIPAVAGMSSATTAKVSMQTTAPKRTRPVPPRPAQGPLSPSPATSRRREELLVWMRFPGRGPKTAREVATQSRIDYNNADIARDDLKALEQHGRLVRVLGRPSRWEAA